MTCQKHVDTYVFIVRVHNLMIASYYLQMSFFKYEVAQVLILRYCKNVRTCSL